MAGVKGSRVALRQGYFDSLFSTYKWLKIYIHDHSHMSLPMLGYIVLAFGWLA